MTRASQTVEHPFLFQAEMARAILAGRKTQTRRLVTPRTSYFDGGSVSKQAWSQLDFSEAWIDPGPSPAGNAGPYLKVPRSIFDEVRGEHIPNHSVHRIYPRYRVGDYGWVRETWQLVRWLTPDDARDWRGSIPKERPSVGHEVLYRATHLGDDYPGRWRPGIHMPRWASREIFVIESIRPERVQEISDDDILAEGVTPRLVAAKASIPEPSSLRDAWRIGWDLINGKRCPYETNPWLWVVTFRRVYGPQREADALVSEGEIGEWQDEPRA